MGEVFIPSSANVAQAEYDRDSQTMAVTFHDGRKYLYENVPITTWQGLQNAPSAGSYVARQIKGRFNYTEV